jgi:hypothetical protein
VRPPRWSNCKVHSARKSQPFNGKGKVEGVKVRGKKRNAFLSSNLDPFPFSLSVFLTLRRSSHRHCAPCDRIYIRRL